jgi:hypothetical protein
MLNFLTMIAMCDSKKTKKAAYVHLWMQVDKSTEEPVLTA